MRHAAIIPLAGGLALGAERAFGRPPEYVLSFSPFWGNDRHLMRYYADERGDAVPYHVLDEGGHRDAIAPVDAVHSVCPCAGLSTATDWDTPAETRAARNGWLMRAADHVMRHVRPAVYYGENAPTLVTAFGAPVLAELRAVGALHGYAMSTYYTDSLLHGLPQRRKRSFYFFWRGDRAPVLEYFDRPHQRVEDLIRSVRSNSLMEPINPRTPTDDPFYRYVLEELAGGATHREFVASRPEGMVGGRNVYKHIENSGHDYARVEAWMTARGHECAAAKCRYRIEKASRGLGWRDGDRATRVPVDYIGPFIHTNLQSLTHPDEDRYITYREALALMGMPADYDLIDYARTANHACQNVPVPTAADVSAEVLAALEGCRPWVRTPYLAQRNDSRSVEWEMAGSDLTEMFA